VQFVLTIDLDKLPEETGAEVGRILRYWGGAAKDLDYRQPARQALYDSSYAEVGEWSISG